MTDILRRQVQSIRDRLKFFVTHSQVMKPWVDFTPALTQGVGVGVTVDYARYNTIGDLASMQIKLTCTGGGTAGSPITISGLPGNVYPAQAGADCVIGQGMVKDDPGITKRVGVVIAEAADSWIIQESGQWNPVGQSPSFGLSSGDQVIINAHYER